MSNKAEFRVRVSEGRASPDPRKREDPRYFSAVVDGDGVICVSDTHSDDEMTLELHQARVVASLLIQAIEAAQRACK